MEAKLEEVETDLGEKEEILKAMKEKTKEVVNNSKII